MFFFFFFLLYFSLPFLLPPNDSLTRYPRGRNPNMCIFYTNQFQTFAYLNTSSYPIPLLPQWSLFFSLSLTQFFLVMMMMMMKASFFTLTHHFTLTAKENKEKRKDFATHSNLFLCFRSLECFYLFLVISWYVAPHTCSQVLSFTFLFERACAHTKAKVEKKEKEMEKKNEGEV